MKLQIDAHVAYSGLCAKPVALPLQKKAFGYL